MPIKVNTSDHNLWGRYGPGLDKLVRYDYDRDVHEGGDRDEEGFEPPSNLPTGDGGEDV